TLCNYLLIEFSILILYVWFSIGYCDCSYFALFSAFRMTRNGQTSTQGSAPTAAGSTAGNLSQLLLCSSFRKVSKKNSS
ncbi:hypothetical protein PIB30_097636, partial [Stylosanthes scabra]|nr:hypothetical protein [Stylosanthes scabra]